MLEKTGRSVADICFANGFASIKQFQTAFKKQYGVPPTVYRTEQKRLSEGEPAGDWAGEALKERLRERLDWYSSRLRDTKSARKRLVIPGQRVSVQGENYSSAAYLEKNLKCQQQAYDILNMTIQKSISAAQKEIGFEFLHFHGLFDDTMRVYYEKPDGRQCQFPLY